MENGVPSVTQFPEAAYVMLKAAARMIGTKMQAWVESKKSIQVLVRVLNLGPDIVDQLTREVPLIEMIKYKAELLGLTMIDFSSIVLPENATGWMFRNAPLENYIAALQQLGLISDRLKSGQLSLELSTHFVDAENERLHRQCRNSDATFTPSRLPIWKKGETQSKEPKTPVFVECWNYATIRDYLDCCLDISVRARMLGDDPPKAVIQAFGVRVPRGRLAEVYDETFYTSTLYRKPGYSEDRLMIIFHPQNGHISIRSEGAFDPNAQERDNCLRCLRVPYVGCQYPSE